MPSSEARSSWPGVTERPRSRAGPCRPPNLAEATTSSAERRCSSSRASAASAGPTRRGRSCGSTWVAGGHDASVDRHQAVRAEAEARSGGPPRLLERLRAGSGSRLTLLSAPAGFGKTTLLAEWLGSDADPDRAVAWLSLDRADHDAASFWTGVATAFDVAVLDHRSRALELTGSTPLPVDNLLTVLVNELAETTVETWLVLDDYHLVDNRDIDRAVAFLLDHLPPHVHVVISTRADPDLPLSR